MMRFRPSLLIASLMALLAAVTPATAALDPTFSGDGVFIPDVQGAIDGLAIDGTDIVATGSVGSLAAFRITSDGQLDTSFGGDGVFTLPDFGGGGVGIVPRAGGGYWVGGWVREPTVEATQDFALVAITSAGELDTSFGAGNGLVAVDLGGDDTAEAMALDPLGRILLAGRSVEPNGATSSDIAVVRFTSAGVPDTSFAGDGRATYPGGSGEDGASGIASTAAAQPIIVGTSASSGDGSSQLVLVRLEEDGDLDPTFGDGGMVLPDLRPHSAGEAVKVLANGNVLVGATVWGNPTPGTHVTDLLDFAVARFSPDGSLDSSFGASDGFTVTSVGKEDRVGAVGTFADGSILLAGDTGGSISDHALVRYTKGGILDPLFSKQTKNLWSDQFGNRSDDDVMALQMLPDDRYVVGGTSWVALNGLTGYRISLARYRGAGVACTKVGTRRSDAMRGTRRSDVLCGVGGNDMIKGVGGVDRLYGGLGDDSLYGGSGDDSLFGEAGSDLMDGGTGRDTCRDRQGKNHRTSCEH